MIRYCINCQKQCDFTPEEIIGKSDLICPGCGNVIPKNSTVPPAKQIDTLIRENKIGNVFSRIMHFAYIFYMMISIAGIVGYFMKAYTLLYVMTGIAVGVFLIQLFTGMLIFRSGIVFLPAGAIAGYFLLNGIPGACLGILAVFLARHVIRDLIYRFLFWIIGKFTKAS